MADGRATHPWLGLSYAPVPPAAARPLGVPSALFVQAVLAAFAVLDHLHVLVVHGAYLLLMRVICPQCWHLVLDRSSSRFISS